jgi:acyl carrier protein
MRASVERIMGGGADAFDDDLYLDDVPGLDSLAFVDLINEAEKRFGRTIELKDLADAETVGELRAIISGDA